MPAQALGQNKTCHYLPQITKSLSAYPPAEVVKLHINQLTAATNKKGRNVFHQAVMNKNHGLSISKLIKEKYNDLKFQKDADGDTILANEHYRTLI